MLMTWSLVDPWLPLVITLSLIAQLQLLLLCGVSFIFVHCKRETRPPRPQHPNVQTVHRGKHDMERSRSLGELESDRERRSGQCLFVY